MSVNLIPTIWTFLLFSLSLRTSNIVHLKADSRLDLKLHNTWILDVSSRILILDLVFCLTVKGTDE